MTELDALQDFHRHELTLDTYSDRAWSAWLGKVSELTGIANLDGENSADAKAAGNADGYSLDELSDQFDAGWSPRRSADAISANRKV